MKISSFGYALAIVTLLVAIWACCCEKSHAQGLVTADGVQWDYVGTAQDRFDGVKFTVYARHLKGDSKRPAIEIKFQSEREERGTFKSEHDCKRRMFRTDGETQWRKPQLGSIGVDLVKFACHK